MLTFSLHVFYIGYHSRSRSLSLIPSSNSSRLGVKVWSNTATPWLKRNSCGLMTVLQCSAYNWRWNPCESNSAGIHQGSRNGWEITLETRCRTDFVLPILHYFTVFWHERLCMGSYGGMQSPCQLKMVIILSGLIWPCQEPWVFPCK